MSPKKDTQKSAKSSAAMNKKFKGFTAEERAAMKERIEELKASARRGPRANKSDGEDSVLAEIAEMPEPDRAMWPTAFALTALTAADEARIVALVKKAVS